MFIKQDCGSVARSKKKFVEIDLKFLAYVGWGAHNKEEAQYTQTGGHIVGLGNELWRAAV